MKASELLPPRAISCSILFKILGKNLHLCFLFYSTDSVRKRHSCDLLHRHFHICTTIISIRGWGDGNYLPNQQEDPTFNTWAHMEEMVLKSHCWGDGDRWVLGLLTRHSRCTPELQAIDKDLVSKEMDLIPCHTRSKVQRTQWNYVD